MSRLIDAINKEYAVASACSGLTRMINGEKWIRVSEVRESIMNAPTIDAVEVVHGEWIDNKGLYQCSCCKHIWSELWWVESCPIDRMNKIMHYCPNCGAKMDGEVKHE